MTPLARSFVSFLIAGLGVILTSGSVVMAQDSIRAQAVVDLTFDEESGDVLDTAATGTVKDNGALKNDPTRVASPFWNQAGKKGIVFDAGRKQLVSIADSTDIDRPDAVTLSFFYLSLHPLNDGTAHGIVAKRIDQPAPSTNYGINYVPSANNLQVYVNHGAGFRVGQFSLKDVIGFSRRVHLTATYEVADAPAPDADTDKDDIVLRLFANGQPVKPTAAPAGTIAGNDVWFTDIHPAGLLNDVPLTLGSTNEASEHTSCVIDEFLLFPRALAAEEVAKLFTEVAGPNGSELAKQEVEPAPVPPSPQVTNLSLRGLQIGRTTRLTIAGQNLADAPRIELAIPNLQQTVAAGSNAGTLHVDLAVPADAVPGYYPLRVATAHGLSNAAVLAVDHLTQQPIAGVAPDQPATLPAAFSGVISGAAQQRIYFDGKAGQRVVADVEARRLGAAMDPVLEIKNAQGTPLAIEWGKVFLRGDSRAELTLPADGRYFVELHDLAYKAPGANPFRLKVGDLAVVDAYFPAAVTRGSEQTLTPVGTGLGSDAAVRVELPAEHARPETYLPVPAQVAAPVPAVPVRVSDAVEVMEAAQPEGQRQTIDARFAEHKHVPVVVNGRISQPGEKDVFTLQVTPGQPLTLSVEGRAIDSPIDAEVSVLINGNVQARQVENGNARDPQLNYTPPAGTQEIQVAVADLFGRGGSHFLYRLKIIPTGQPEFRLTVAASKVEVPSDGTALLELQVDRNGYNGPIALSTAGDAALSIAPAQITSGGKVFVTLRRQGADAGTVQGVQIIGETTGLTPAVRRIATMTASAGDVTVPGHKDQLMVVTGKPVEFSIAVSQVPAGLMKGKELEIPVTVTRTGTAADKFVRLTLVTSEADRREQPNNPNSALKPKVRALPGQTIATDATTGAVKVAVPADVAEAALEVVVKAELVAHAYSAVPLATTYSQPFRLKVEAAPAP